VNAESAFYASTNVVSPEALCFLAVRESVCLCIRASRTFRTGMNNQVLGSKGQRSRLQLGPISNMGQGRRNRPIGLGC